MITAESSNKAELVTFTGGGGGAALVHLADMMPDVHVTMAVSTADSGSRTNDLRRLYLGPAVGDLRKVLGHASRNGAGELFLTRFTSGDTVDTVKRINERFLGAIATQGSEDASLAARVTDAAAVIAKECETYREAGLEKHTYGNFILTALRFQDGKTDNLTEAALTANAWLETRATVLPVTDEAHNLVMYDEAADAIVYGEGAIDVYELEDPSSIEVWLERGETRNGIERDPSKVRTMLEMGRIAARPRATPAVVAAIRRSRWTVLGPGSPVTSLPPAVLPDGVGKALREQAENGGEWLAVENPEVEHTTPGLSPDVYLTQIETAVGRSFDRRIDGVKREKAHAAGRLACALQAVPQYA